MDQRTFDHFTRLLAGAATRRTGLKTALGALFGAAALEGRADAKGPEAEGPCGNGKRKDNQCTKDSQCCTGICDINLGKKNKDKKGRCRCLKNGKPCSDDRNCCKTSVCYEGSCTDCRKKNQTCYETGDCCGSNVCPNGTCVPCKSSTQACSSSADCCSGLSCFDGTCAACASDGKSCSSDGQCCSGLACFDGTCAACASDGTSCSSDAQCCAGLGCYDGACVACIPDGGTCGVVSFTGDGKHAKAFTLTCCSGLICDSTVCRGPQVVPTGDPCREDFDTCKNPEATCEEYEFATPAGTYCLLPRKAACQDDLDCWSQDCPGDYCVACSHPACVTSCDPIVCKGNACDYDTIQEAINAAADGDVIDIGTGFYIEDLTVDKNITLRACRTKPVTIQNATYDVRTITVTNGSSLELIDITVEALSDPDNGRYGGGIATTGYLGLYRYSKVRNGAWDAGGGILVGGYLVDGSLGLESTGTRGKLSSPRAKLFGKGHGQARKTRNDNRAHTVEARNARTISPQNGDSYTVTHIADQTIIEGNTADVYGGGIYAAYMGTTGVIDPQLSVPYPKILVTDAAVISDNDVVAGFIKQQSIVPQDFYGSGGGGIFAMNAIVELHDDSHIFRNTSDANLGGGIFITPDSYSYSVLMTGNAKVSQNRAPAGGGITIANGFYGEWSGLKMSDDSIITENKADSYAAGVMLIGAPLWMEDNATIDANISLGRIGAGMIVGPFSGQDSYGLWMTNSSSIKNNTAVSDAAGITLVGAWADIQDSAIITGNVAELDGGGVYLQYDTTNSKTAKVLLSNSATITLNVAGNSGIGTGGGVYSDNPLNVVELDDTSSIEDNNPDDCVGSNSPACIA